MSLRFKQLGSSLKLDALLKTANMDNSPLLTPNRENVEAGDEEDFSRKSWKQILCSKTAFWVYFYLILVILFIIAGWFLRARYE
ncbi:unnamed protein product, partial [Mesorhabditis belari]|uniref:Uncharacterized protein n=1 Tax=Mesorhabditis belari TaxID=2138241 RepID=A0AAF3FNS2_9BILA